MKRMNANRVLMLAEIVAAELGLKLTDKMNILKGLKAKFPIPLILSQNGYRVWLDRYYIAYSKNDEWFVHYIYISREHTREELSAVLKMLDVETNLLELKMLNNIRAQLANAVRKMNSDGTAYYILPKYYALLEAMLERPVS